MARKRRGIPIHGWLNIDKPAGMSSARVVAAVKRITQAEKAGHAGTLDPFATGVLPIALGEATKTVPYMVSEHKEYRFTVCWGEARDTDDVDGDTTDVSESRPSKQDILSIIPEFIGTLQQIPPIYSAIKINGQRAYKLAREGSAPEMSGRNVEIYDLTLIECIDRDHATLDVQCGKGTYIRALARDIAHKMGTFGYLTALRRTRVGPFFSNSAISLDKLEQLWQCPAEFEDLLPITTPLDDIPAVAMTEAQADRLRHGNDVAVPNHADGIVCAMDGKTPIGIAKIANERMFPVRVFNF
jgi:tRNA pseudouridine55 synthase